MTSPPSSQWFRTIQCMNDHTIRHVTSVLAIVAFFVLLALLAMTLSQDLLAAAAPRPLILP